MLEGPTSTCKSSTILTIDFYLKKYYLAFGETIKTKWIFTDDFWSCNWKKGMGKYIGSGG